MMSPDDKAWLIQHLEDRMQKVEGKLELLHDRLASVVTWRSLGTAVVIGVGLATLLLAILGTRAGG